jgi:peroxiredoxin family protein
MREPLVIFLHSATYDRLFQTANLLVTASSMGQPCYLFLFYGALATFMNGSWDRVELDPPAGSLDWAKTLARSFELADTPSLYELIEMARGEAGGLTVAACSTSMNLLGLDPAAVQAKVDRIIGHAAMLEIASRSRQVLYI